MLMVLPTLAVACERACINVSAASPSALMWSFANFSMATCSSFAVPCTERTVDI